MRALVTIGYHYGELSWGRHVKYQYERFGLGRNKDIVFYVVKTSNVKTGSPCQRSLDEIASALGEVDAGLWIDIHCGLYAPYEQRGVVLSYRSIDDRLLERARSIPGVSVNDCRIIPDFSPFRTRSYIVNTAVADAFFSRSQFIRKGGIYRQKLARTLDFINEMYDLHLQ